MQWVFLIACARRIIELVNPSPNEFCAAQKFVSHGVVSLLVLTVIPVWAGLVKRPGLPRA